MKRRQRILRTGSTVRTSSRCTSCEFGDAYETFNLQGEEPGPDPELPLSDDARSTETRLDMVRAWLGNMSKPPNLSDKDRKSFVKYAGRFFPTSNDTAYCNRRTTI